MTREELKLAGAVLVLRGFTAVELSRFSGVNPHTTRSWLSRNEGLFQKDRQRSSGRGRPPETINLLPEALPILRGRMDEIRRTVSGGEGGDRLKKRTFDKIEAQFDSWRASSSSGDPASEMHHGSLRMLIRLAWEDFATTSELGRAPEQRDLKTLAEIERDIGIGELPNVAGIKELAVWLANRIKQMRGRSVSVEFAGKTLRTRVEVRSRADRAKLTGASLGAPIWSDENVASHAAASPEDLMCCDVVAKQTPVDVRIAELADVLDGSGLGLCTSHFDAQALARGLTYIEAKFEADIINGWLARLQFSRLWTETLGPALAPVALHRLADAPDTDWTKLLNSLRGDLKKGLEASRSAPLGRLRKMTLDYAETALRSGADRNVTWLAYRPSDPETRDVP